MTEIDPWPLDCAAGVEAPADPTGPAAFGFVAGSLASPNSGLEIGSVHDCGRDHGNVPVAQSDWKLNRFSQS
jgi:hypothetical protein